NGVPLDTHLLPSVNVLERSPCQASADRGVFFRQMISLIRLPSVTSATSRKIAVRTTNNSVAWVDCTTSRRVGQVTLPSSARELRRYCTRPRNTSDLDLSVHRVLAVPRAVLAQLELGLRVAPVLVRRVV